MKNTLLFTTLALSLALPAYAMEEEISKGLQRLECLEKGRLSLLQQLEDRTENIPVEEQAEFARMQEAINAQQSEIARQKSFLEGYLKLVEERIRQGINDNNTGMAENKSEETK